ncbi:MAG: ATP synthase F1 subunit delta [Chitinophagales bacterium]
MSASNIASRYAKALMGLAIERGELSSVHGDVELLDKSLEENPDLKILLKSPVVNTEKKQSILTKIFGGVFNETTNSFMGIILRKRREAFLPEIVDAFIAQYRAHKSITTAELITAVPVGDELLMKVKEMVLANTGRKNIELTTKVDKSLIGGFILTFDDKLYDSSISHKLTKLRKQFVENKYIKKY